MSQNEALRLRGLSGGAGARAHAIHDAGTGVSQAKNRGEARLALLEFEAAGLAMTNDGPRPSGTHNPGSVRFDVTPAASRGGFKVAHRHSARVRVLRGAAIGGSLLAIALISAAVLLNPLRRLPGDISIGRVGVDGTKITVDSLKITGVQRDGHPFEIHARTGIQDTTDPNTVELLGVDSKIGTADSTTTQLRAEHGIYDSLNDKMTLEGDVRIKNSSGYDLRLKTALMDFKTGGLVSEEPVKVFLDGGTVTARQLEVSNNGHKVSFDGEVISMFDNGARAPKGGQPRDGE